MCEKYQGFESPTLHQRRKNRGTSNSSVFLCFSPFFSVFGGRNLGSDIFESGVFLCILLYFGVYFVVKMLHQRSQSGGKLLIELPDGILLCLFAEVGVDVKRCRDLRMTQKVLGSLCIDAAFVEDRSEGVPQLVCGEVRPRLLFVSGKAFAIL